MRKTAKTSIPEVVCEMDPEKTRIGDLIRAFRRIWPNRSRVQYAGPQVRSKTDPKSLKTENAKMNR